MKRFNDLKINTKLNLILSTLLIGLFLLTGLLTYREQRAMLLNIALEHARGIATQIIETRNYMAEVVRDEPEKNYDLIPEAVATGIAKRLTSGGPYYVRQISERYRNPNNQPDPYEAAQLKEFDAKSTKENYQTTRIDGEQLFRYLREMVAEESCLRCHGAYAEAPQFVQQRFPAGHPSYNYNVGEIIGAISVTVPLDDLFGELGHSMVYELISRLVVLLLVFIVVGLLIKRFITNPIRLASATMGRVTKTGSLAERIPVEASNDEIGELINGFNEMMATLDRTNLQRQESEDRYHNLVEASETGIITFLKNGKIVISNRRAEMLLSMTKQELLGMSIFDLLEKGEGLKQKVAELDFSGSPTGINAVFQDKTQLNAGQQVEVEVTLILASATDNVPMFTVLLKAEV